MIHRTLALYLLTLALSLTAFAEPKQESKTGITHSFFVASDESYIVNEEGKVSWKYPVSSREGWVLENGNVLIAATKSKTYPGGAVVEVNKDGKVMFEYRGTQSEVDTVQPLAEGHILLTESGANPRLLEIDREGKVLVEIKLQCQTKDHHMQTRMARKLKNGNYLAPHLIDKVVREYNAKGEVVWEVKTPNWPFTAIRLENGNTLINCTVGNMVIEVDKDGKTVWELSNKDLGGDIIKDACGGQRLPNGNTVITSYRTGAADVKLFEVTPEKKIVWTWTDGKPYGIHEFQILQTNGKALEGTPMR